MTECSARRREILDAAADLFARKGVAATTIREIADRVGVVSGRCTTTFRPSSPSWTSSWWAISKNCNGGTGHSTH